MGSSCRRTELQPNGRLKFACTFLPVYVFTLNVVGQTPDVEVELLLPANTGCPHVYAMRPADVKRLARADWVIANGLGMEPFLDEWLRTNPQARVMTISDDCEVIAEEHDHPANHDHAADHESHAHESVNGHVWVSPREAVRQVRTLARKLAAADPARGEDYKANAEAYIGRLEALHRRMTEAAKGFINRRIVTSHDAFAYLARDLDLTVVATLSSDTGHAPSSGELTTAVSAIRQTGAAAVFFEAGSAERIARTVAAEAKVPALPLNPLNSHPGMPSADTYETVMADNLRVLQQVLGGGS